jgi:Thioredoxin
VTHVHALCTIVENVGGGGGTGSGGSGSDTSVSSSSSNFLNIPKKVVILGGHENAVNAAQALAVLGSQVTLVSTNAKKLNLGGTNTKNSIQTLTPASGELELGFADVVGTFDALLDTIGNELPQPGDSAFFNSYKDDDDDDDDEESFGINRNARRRGAPPGTTRTSTVVRLLQKLHSCNTYVSTCSGAEQVIAREGLLFGPNKAKEHMQQLMNVATTSASATSTSSSSSSSSSSRNSRDSSIAVVQAVPKIGSTVETLLEAGFVWGGGSGNGGGISGLLNTMNAAKAGGGTSISGPPQVRGWSMPAAWEATTWPRDTSGNVRFGLPVLQGTLSDDDDDDDDDDDGRMISKPPLTARRQQLDEEELDEEAQNDDPMDLPVMQVVGLKGLNRQILARADQNVILFLSAPFCRTCRRLTTPYTRMARANKRVEKKQKPQVPLVFAKADASGLEGKTLGRALSVEAVPAFVLFKNGKRYGSTLSVSKIPSEQLDMAMEYLRDGRAWDNDAFRPQNTGRQTSLKER